MLELVENRAGAELFQEPPPVAERFAAHVERFERDEGLLGEDVPAEGGLAGLTGAGHRHHGVGPGELPQGPS